MIDKKSSVFDYDLCRKWIVGSYRMCRKGENVEKWFSFYPDGDSYTATGQKEGQNWRSKFEVQIFEDFWVGVKVGIKIPSF